MHTALYARVSTERQERQQTIDSQFAALGAWAAAEGHRVIEMPMPRSATNSLRSIASLRP